MTTNPTQPDKYKCLTCGHEFVGRKKRLMYPRTCSNCASENVEPTQDQLKEWKQEIGEIPDNTCPDIDKAIKEIETFCKEVEYVQKNKSRFEDVDDVIGALPSFWDYPAVSILEDLRKDNLQLRELGKFWYEKCVDLSQLPTPDKDHE